MHQEPYQDTCHCHQNRVVVHALQAYGREEGDELPRGSWLMPSAHPMSSPQRGTLKLGVPSPAIVVQNGESGIAPPGRGTEACGVVNAGPLSPHQAAAG